MAGVRKAISANRALVLDTLYFARSVPSFSVERTFELKGLAALRQASPVRISWSVLFLKAYAQVVAEQPLLRQIYLPWPWPHLYESSETTAALAIAREFEQVERLCWGCFQNPATTPLAELQIVLDHFQHWRVDDVFRRQVRLSRLPAWLRRIAWRIGLYLNVSKRTKRFGTFSLSSLAGQGVLNRSHPTIHTTSLTYGPIDASGNCLVTLLCDHRVIDGLAAARALNYLEDVLRGDIATELADLAQCRAAA